MHKYYFSSDQTSESLLSFIDSLVNIFCLMLFKQINDMNKKEKKRLRFK